MKKLMLGIITALSLNLTGCLTNAVFDLDYYQAPKATNADTVSGFVINKDDGKLIMIGQNFVYVFDANDNVEQLKALLNSPRVSNMQWKIASDISSASSLSLTGKYQDHALRVYEKDQIFTFSAHFEYDVQNAQDKATINAINAVVETPTFSVNETNNRVELKYLRGKVYRDNSPIVQKARQNAQALSKQYDFTLYTDADKISPIKATQFLLLPFAIVGDIITSPIQMFDGLRGW